MKQKVNKWELLFVVGLMLVLVAGLWATSGSGLKFGSQVLAGSAPQVTTGGGNESSTIVSPGTGTGKVMPAALSGSGATGQVTFWTGTESLSGDNNLYWDNTNKRLGIGTATPSRLLHLKGNICLFERNVNSAGFIMERNGVDVTGYNRWVFGADEPTGFVIKTYPVDGGAAVEQLVITKDDPGTGFNEGRVGIGTTSPDFLAKVHVVSNNMTDYAKAIYGQTTATTGITYGIYGEHTDSGNYGYLGDSARGVYGHGTGYGVWGSSTSGVGVYGMNSTGNYGYLGDSQYGVYGRYGTDGPYGYMGDSSYGVKGWSDNSRGVYGRSETGEGVYGSSGGSASSSYGVFGEGATGVYGVSGFQYGYLGDSTYGVYGQVESGDTRYGVYGKHNGSENFGRLGGLYEGAYGRYGTDGPYGYLGGLQDGVHGNSGVAGGKGVYGEGTSGYGVWGEGSIDGVHGYSVSGSGVKGESTNSYGVYGLHGGNGPYGVLGQHNYGVYGNIGTTAGTHAGYFDGNVHVQGNLSASGTKPFVAADPTDPTKEIWYVSLEGPEAGTYIRGSAELVAGEAVIELPEHFAKVTADQGLTVQLTPVGKWLQLYVAEKSTSRIVVGEATGQSGSFDYLVNGIRTGYEDFQVIRDRTSVPMK